MTPSPKQPISPDVFEAYLLGQLSQEQTQALDERLRNDPALLRQFAEAIHLMSLTRHEFAGQAQYQAAHQQEPLLEDFNTLLKELGEFEAQAPVVMRSLDAPPKQKKQKASDALSMHDFVSAGQYVIGKAITSKPVILSAAAAIVLLALILINPFASNTPDAPEITDNTPNKPAESAPPILRDTPVATLTAQHNAQWDSQPGEDLRPGASFTAGTRLTLTAGFAEITTNRGAIAILQAPATIELLDNNNALQLHSGKLVGICETDSSKGFLVRTPNLDITDLGTRFGVAIDDKGNTLAEVFKGSVEIQLTGGLEAYATPEQLAPGESFAVSPRGTRIASEHFTPGVFAQLSEAMVGTDLQLSGEVRWLPYDFVGSDPATWPIDEQSTVVIEEMRDTLVQSDFPVILNKPGKAVQFRDVATSGQVRAGTHIRSYAVLFNPGTTVGRKQCRGKVTFQGDVLGVIASPTHAKAWAQAIGNDASRALGHNNPSSYSWPEDGSGLVGDDSVILEADGRTLAFHFTAHGSSDMVHVIVREPASGQSPTRTDQPTKED